MPSPDKQHYLPIEDQIILTWRILTPQEKARRIQEFSASEVSPENTSEYIEVEGNLFEIIQNLVHQEPDVARAIHLLNRKINLIAKRKVAMSPHPTLLEKKPEKVVLSANGLAFTIEEDLKLKTELQIELILLPENQYIICYGVVSDLKPEKENKKLVTVDFLTIRDDDQDKIIEHILRKEDANYEMRNQ